MDATSPEPFGRLHHFVIDNHLPSLSNAALRVLAVLTRFANAAGRSWPSVATIATKAGITPRSVQHGLAQLKSKGLLHVETGRGRKVVSHYRIIGKGETDFAYSQTKNTKVETQKHEHPDDKTRNPFHTERIQEQIQEPNQPGGGLVKVLEEPEADAPHPPDSAPLPHPSPTPTHTPMPTPTRDRSQPTHLMGDLAKALQAAAPQSPASPEAPAADFAATPPQRRDDTTARDRPAADVAANPTERRDDTTARDRPADDVLAGRSQHPARRRDELAAALDQARSQHPARHRDDTIARDRPAADVAANRQHPARRRDELAAAVDEARSQHPARHRDDTIARDRPDAAVATTRQHPARQHDDSTARNRPAALDAANVAATPTERRDDTTARDRPADDVLAGRSQHPARRRDELAAALDEAGIRSPAVIARLAADPDLTPGLVKSIAATQSEGTGGGLLVCRIDDALAELRRRRQRFSDRRRVVDTQRLLRVEEDRRAQAAVDAERRQLESIPDDFASEILGPAMKPDWRLRPMTSAKVLANWREKGAA